MAARAECDARATEPVGGTDILDTNFRLKNLALKAIVRKGPLYIYVIDCMRGMIHLHVILAQDLLEKPSRYLVLIELEPQW